MDAGLNLTMTLHKVWMPVWKLSSRLLLFQVWVEDGWRWERSVEDAAALQGDGYALDMNITWPHVKKPNYLKGNGLLWAWAAMEASLWTRHFIVNSFTGENMLTFPLTTSLSRDVWKKTQEQLKLQPGRHFMILHNGSMLHLNTDLSDHTIYNEIGTISCTLLPISSFFGWRILFMKTSWTFGRQFKYCSWFRDRKSTGAA